MIEGSGFADAGATVLTLDLGEPGRLYGSILDDTNSQGVFEAEVTLTGSQTFTTLTGPDGVYVFTGLPIESYGLSVCTEAYMTPSAQTATPSGSASVLVPDQRLTPLAPGAYPCCPDTVRPALSFDNGPVMAIDCCGTFTDPSITVTDLCDPSPTLTRVSPLPDTRTPGSYKVNYAATDAFGNSAPLILDLIVLDNCGLSPCFNIHADFRAASDGDGTEASPSNSFQSAINLLGAGGTIHIHGDANGTEHYYEGRITKPMTIRALDGPVTIGRSGGKANPGPAQFLGKWLRNVFWQIAIPNADTPAGTAEN